MLECASQTLKHVCYVFFIEPSIKISEYFSIFKRFYKFDLFPPLLFKFTLHHIEIRIESRLQPVQWTPIARPTYIRQQLDRNVLVPNIHTIHIQNNSKYFVPASPGTWLQELELNPAKRLRRWYNAFTRLENVLVSQWKRALYFSLSLWLNLECIICHLK